MNFGDLFQSMHLDAQGNALFLTQLRQVLAGSFDQKFPDLMARKLIPVSYEINPGAAVIEWRSYSGAGMVDFLASYGDDIPYVDVTGEQNFSPVRTVAGGFRYNLDEMLASQYAGGQPLDARRAAWLRYLYEVKIDQLAALGDSNRNLVGILNIPNATAVTIPSGATGGADQTWATKTPQEIVDDLNNIPIAVRELTNGAEAIDTIVVPLKQYGLIATKKYVDYGATTILEYFQKANPSISVLGWYRCKGAGASGSDRLLAYRRDPRALQLHIPKELAPVAPQEYNLTTRVPHHGRFGGVVCYYPLSVAFADHV